MSALLRLYILVTIIYNKIVLSNIFGINNLIVTKSYGLEIDGVKGIELLRNSRSSIWIRGGAKGISYEV